jgi:hypothetical protein
MAARRLVIVMLVLLGISTLAAALVPTDRNDSATEATDTVDAGSDEKPERQNGASRLVRRRIRITDKPAVVHVHPGEQVRLAVAGPFGDDIEIPALGLTAAMTPYAPATFDLIVPEPGTFAVRAVQTGMLVGRIEARPAQAGCPRRPAPRERSRPEGCDRRDERQAPAGDRSDRRPSAAAGRRRQ